ncbi:MAG: hypothetical protein DMF37_06850 [Verrucomicrobia bacterium]|nr:MAG: hypothetical protein DMF37_06850 [Verrucomicrobiota bacterium]
MFVIQAKRALICASQARFVLSVIAVAADADEKTLGCRLATNRNAQPLFIIVDVDAVLWMCARDIDNRS